MFSTLVVSIHHNTPVNCIKSKQTNQEKQRKWSSSSYWLQLPIYYQCNQFFFEYTFQARQLLESTILVCTIHEENHDTALYSVWWAELARLKLHLLSKDKLSLPENVVSNVLIEIIIQCRVECHDSLYVHHLHLPKMLEFTISLNRAYKFEAQDCNCSKGINKDGLVRHIELLITLHVSTVRI